MRKPSRWGAIVIAGAATIGACDGEVQLAETQQASMSVAPSPAQFGMVLVGTSSLATIKLAPRTALDRDTVTAVTKGATGCDDFTVVPTRVLPAEVYCETDPDNIMMGACRPLVLELDVTFAPTIPGPASCVVTINHDSGSGVTAGTEQMTTVQLHGNGLSPPYQIALTSKALHFGDVPVAQTSTAQQVTVSNTGTEPLVIDTTSTSAKFPVTPVMPAVLVGQMLPAGGTFKLDVACALPMLGMNTGEIRIAPRQGGAGTARVITLECTGIDTAIEIDPSPARFDEYTLVGRTPPPITVTIRNPSGSAVTIDSVALSSDSRELSFVDQLEDNTVVQAGASAVQRLAYAATMESPYGRLGSLLVRIDGVERAVTINGEALTGAVAASPSTVDFGPVCAGARASELVGVYTTAAGAVSVMGIQQPMAPFTASGDTPTRLAPNHGSMLMVTATIDAEGEGPRRGLISVTTNIPGPGTLEIPVAATVLPAGITPTPATAHFGAEALGDVSGAQQITISNCSSGAKGIMSAVIEGEAAGEFTIVTPSDPSALSIPERGKVDLLLIMNPRTVGARTARLVVTLSDGSVTETALEGTGFTVAGSPEEGTYYTCSTSSAGGGLLPIGLALLATRRRRRC